jgi:hypothetical protein
MSDKQDKPDWGDLQDIWQTGPAADMAGMARRARFVWWRMRINFVTEVAMCLVGIGFMAHFMWAEASLLRLTFGALMSAFCLFGIWAAFYIRRGAWGAEGGSAQDLIALQVRRARSGIRYVAINNRACALAVPILLFGVVVSIFQSTPTTTYKVWYASLFAGGFMLFSLAFWYFSRRYVAKKRREIRELEEIAAQLEHEDTQAD